MYQLAYSHTLNNHTCEAPDAIELEAATWMVYTMSRDGMGKSFSPQKFKSQKYQAAIGKLYDVAERMEWVEASQVGALLYLMNSEYLNDPRACFCLDPSYLAPADEERNLGSPYKLSSDKQDHELLLQTIQEAKTKIVISNYDVSLYNQYLSTPRWKKHEIDTHTSVGRLANNHRTEVF